MVDFLEFDLDELDDELVASSSVSQSGLRDNSLKAGIYSVTVEEMTLRTKGVDATYCPGRRSANFRFKTEDGKTIFGDASWEPAESTDDGTDGSTRLYSNLEVALDMYGMPIKQVLSAASTASFRLELNQSAKVRVEQLPEKEQKYYLEVKGLGETSEVNFYVKEADEETRLHLLGQGVKLRNYIRSILPN